ncbi:MAG: PEP/pyruvate-binding domain-containing protein [Pseudomonadota bacterium]|nr:PEP/pyruvate-binding domain-containing protein [Pseudomonadota bacterium]
MTKYIHPFENPLTDKINQSLIGNKGYNLCVMYGMGLPIPEGFIINSIASKDYINNSDFNKNFENELKENIKKIEKKTNLEIGNKDKPLILSVRSGSKISMPGMLDTILNVGLNKEIVRSLSKSGSGFFAFDTWRRFIQMFSHVVYKIDNFDFDEILENYLLGANLSEINQLDSEDLEEISDMYLNLFEQRIGKDFPQDPYQQIHESIRAVIKSWENDRAISYRSINDIPEDYGLAVTVQRMVFGNLNDKSASGVVFTRNPDTGENKIKGEYLIKSQGEDVVSGFITPKSISKSEGSNSFADIFKDINLQINEVSKDLEKHFGFVQDIEFTIESGVLWILQSRNAEVNALASFKVLTDMVKEGVIDKLTAIKLIKEEHIEKSLVPILDDAHKVNILTKGLPASPGVTSGQVGFNIDAIKFIKDKGQKAVLVLVETNTNDIKAMHLSDAILTSRGGLTSHAAVVARGLGKPCITGAREVEINPESKTISIGNKKITEFDTITLNGNSGEVIEGIAKTKPQEPPPELKEILDWCKNIDGSNIEDPVTCLKKAKEKI